MPRPVRVHLPGALYFISAHAAEGLTLFRDHDDYQTYLNFLQTYRAQFGFKLFAYALLPGRLYLVIELTNETTISEIMHALSSRYTKHMAKRYGVVGHVFQSRFRSALVEKAPSLLPLTSFVHRLPQADGLAADARAYPWSSCAAYLTGGRYAGGMDLRPEAHEVLCGLSATQRYETLVEGVSGTEFAQWQALLEKPVVGSPAFQDMVRERAAARQLHEAAAATSVPQPAGSPRLHRPAVWAASLAVAVVALGAAGLSVQNYSALRSMVRTLAQERFFTARMAAPASQPQVQQPDARLATFTLPSKLAGTSWDVQITSMAGAESKSVQLDELRFGQGRVTSILLHNQGFGESNYSLTLQPDGTVLWESMLTGHSGETVCWRGERSGDRMQGVMTRQLPGQPAANFTFIGIARPLQQAASFRTPGEA